MILSSQDLDKMDSRSRVNFVNSLSGYKSANIIGTVNNEGVPNAAIFSSAVHLGASPALMGLISRPDSVPRHTLKNIKNTKQFTVNTVHKNILYDAHLTSSRSEEAESEFDFTYLTEEYIDDFPPPFVKQSLLKMAFDLVEVIPINSNGTYLIVGQLLKVILPRKALSKDGFIDHYQLNTLCVSGVDSYHQVYNGSRLVYAKKPS